MFNLQARLRLDGNQFVNSLRRIERMTRNAERTTRTYHDQNGRLRDSMGRFAAQTDRADMSVRRFSSGLGGSVRGFGGLKTAILGAVGAYASLSTAKSIFDKTVASAMKSEVSAITIGAMFDTQKATDNYLKMIQDMALKSPVLNYGDMADGSKRLLALTRDTKTLEKAWKNIEKLQAFAPDKSTADAIRGIAELAAGDVISLREVFNLDKHELNELKSLSFDKQVDGLTKLLEKMKITDSLIEKVGGTTYSKLNQVKEKFDEIFTRVGTPSLDVLSKFFDNVLSRLEGPDAEKLAQVGATWIQKILNGLTTNVVNIYDWFTAISKNPDFQKQTTLFGQVKWIISDVYANFIEWLDGGGREKIANTASDLIQILAASIEASMEVLTPVAVKIGSAIGSGIVDGFNRAVNDSWLIQAITDPKKLARQTALKFIGKKVWDDSQKDSGNQPKSHASGLSNVPYNGYQAKLHKGERVLTPEENREYSQGGGSSGVTVNVYGMTVREDADINRIGDALFRKINSARMAGA